MRRSLSRLGQSLLVIAAAFSLNFVLPHLAPGDPVAYLYQGDAGGLDAAQLDALRADYGLDAPLARQYLDYVGDLVHGDLGVSVQHNRPVAAVLADRLPRTLALVLPAAVVATAVGTLLGAAAARRRGRAADVALTSGTLFVDAMPGFWIGMVLIAVFAGELGWLPSFGAVAPGGGSGGAALLATGQRLVLPVATLVLATFGGTFLLARGAMLTTFDEPHVLLAEAKGAKPRRVVYRHALRTALLPIHTNLSLALAVLFSGATVVETLFGYPGLGRLLYEATIARDYPLLRGAFLLITVTVVVVNVLADLTYPLLDPRVRAPSRTAP